MMPPLPERKWLYHDTPNQVPRTDEIFFITLCCQKRGVTTLTKPAIAEALLNSIITGQKRHDWYFHLVLLMPDHLHGIVSLPADGKSLREQMADWKRLTARRHAIPWQKGFFDHRLRGPKAVQEKYLYILNNPVRAGLCSTPEQWPYQWKP